jgi:hypothetical protein
MLGQNCQAAATSCNHDGQGFIYWAVVVCLVGGGQEINTGEAGIDAWLDAVQERLPAWRMHISSRLTDSEYAAGAARERVKKSPGASFRELMRPELAPRCISSRQGDHYFGG